MSLSKSAATPLLQAMAPARPAACVVSTNPEPVFMFRTGASGPSAAVNPLVVKPETLLDDEIRK